MTRRRPARPPRQAPAGKNGSPQPKRRLTLAAAALGLLALAAYAFYYLDRLPQAVPLDPGLDWRSEPGQAMRLEGVEPGSALAFELKGSASASLSLGLSFDKGAELEPNPDAPPGLRIDDGSLVNLYAFPHERVRVKAVLVDGGGRGIVHVEPALESDALATVRIRAEGARLEVELEAIPDRDEPEHSFIGIGAGDSPMQEARVTLPAGAAFRLRVARKDFGQLKARPLLLGPDTEGFGLRALATGRAGASDFDRLAMACGSPPGRILWRRPVPAVGAGDCEAGHLLVTGFELNDGAAATIEGSGFVVRDRRTHSWPGFRDFRENDVVKTALGFLLASLVGWAFVTLRGARKAGGGGKPGR